MSDCCCRSWVKSGGGPVVNIIPTHWRGQEGLELWRETGGRVVVSVPDAALVPHYFTRIWLDFICEDQLDALMSALARMDECARLAEIERLGFAAV